MESKRTLVVPDRNVGGVLHGECPQDTSRNLHINLQVSTISYESPERHHGDQEHNGGLLRGVLVFLRWWMSQGYIKEATYQFSSLYLPWKCSSDVITF